MHACSTYAQKRQSFANGKKYKLKFLRLITVLEACVQIQLPNGTRGILTLKAMNFEIISNILFNSFEF